MMKLYEEYYLLTTKLFLSLEEIKIINGFDKEVLVKELKKR